MNARLLVFACVLAVAACGAEGDEEIETEIGIEDTAAAEVTPVAEGEAPVDTSIEYGGCECGSRPNPPRPKAEALGVVLVAAYFRRRRRSA